FDNHFSTIGLLGMNEAALNAKWLKTDLTDPRAQKFAREVLNHMRDRLSDYQEKYGDLYNLEATPAESTAYRLAKHDTERWPDIITAATGEGETPYYTNSSHLPVGYTEDIFEALSIQDDLQTLYTSGTVFHAFLGEKLPDWKSTANLVRKIAKNYRLPYYTISPTYSVCKNHGYLAGERSTCPDCGEVTEVYSRITGYYRPVQNWNAGKTQEFKARKLYAVQGEADSAGRAEAPEKRIMLVTTERCPNCAIAKTFLNDAHISYDLVDAEKRPEVATRYAVKSAPTLIVEKGDGYDAFVNLSNIRSFVKETLINSCPHI
ncbi:MAG: ribonucleoside triphosphate reductase, partial [Clostridiales Family XIII bacterium]|nr:ribonucleoside triphosphate reductase [Clostridiales Family XIII bacterium]